MGDLELLAAGFSAVLGVEVVPYTRGAGLPRLSIDKLFNFTYTSRVVVTNLKPGELFDIYVKTLTGKTIKVEVTSSFTIVHVKATIEEQEGIPAQNQRLMFSRKSLNDDETIESVGIPRGGTIYLVLTLRGGGPQCQLPEDELDPHFNYDFTEVQDDGVKYMRGKFRYCRPYGWCRYAMKVHGDSRYGDDKWLGPQGNRTESSSEEWPVSYHGTNLENAKKITKEGMKIGPRDLHGKGVYTSPDLPMLVRMGYTQSFQYDGKNHLIAFQNRVNPEDGHLQIIPAEKTQSGAGEYWVSPKQDRDKGVYDVRPYGVLIRKASYNGGSNSEDDRDTSSSCSIN